MHFKYSANISKEIDRAAHTAAVKAYYFSETNRGEFSKDYLFINFPVGVFRKVVLFKQCALDYYATV